MMVEEKLVKIPKGYFDYFEALYHNNPNVKVAVDVAVENIVGGGFFFAATEQIDKNESKKMVEELNKLSDRLKLPMLMYRIVKDILVLGNAFVEIVSKEGEGIVDLRAHDPRTIGIVIDKNKNLKGYVKVEQDRTIARFNLENLMHFKNPTIKNRFYGRSQVESLIPQLKREIRIQDIPGLDSS